MDALTGTDQIWSRKVAKGEFMLCFLFATTGFSCFSTNFFFTAMFASCSPDGDDEMTHVMKKTHARGSLMFKLLNLERPTRGVL